MLKVISREYQVRTFWLLFALTLVTFIGMQITNAPLKTEVAPGGIITFELVGTLEGSQQIINSWQGEAMTWAGINMGLDFLFLALYGVTIAMACMLVSERLPDPRMKKLGVWLAVGILAAVLLDIVENLALIQLLLGSDCEILPVLAKWCAIPKFLLVLLSLLYALGGVIPVLKKRNKYF